MVAQEQGILFDEQNGNGAGVAARKDREIPVPEITVNQMLKITEADRYGLC